MNKQIFAAGTDIISDIPMHYYLLAQTGKRKPNVCLLPTPSGDRPEVIKEFFKAFNRHNCDADFLPLFFNKVSNHREFLLEQDLIIVCGGHSKSAVGVWKEWGIDEILHEAYDNGTILAGGSAGSVPWFQSAISDSFGDLRPMDFLNFLPYSHCPHYRSEERRIAYKSAILSRKLKPGYAINDGAAIHFKNGEFFRAVCSEENMSAFYVDIDNNGKEEKIKSTRLPVQYLMNRDVQNELIWNAPAFEHLEDAPEPTNPQDELAGQDE